MSQQKELIRDGFRKLLGVPEWSDFVFSASVTEVDKDEWTCTVKLDNDVELHNVQLKAVKEAANGCVLIPKVDSEVQVLRLGEDDYLVVSTEEVDETIFIAAGTKLVMNKDGLFINDGNNGGMVKVDGLVTRLNNIETDINDLRTALKNAPTTAQDGGAAFKGGLAMWYGGNLTKTKKSDLENTKAQH